MTRDARVWRFGDAVNTDDILPGKYAPLMVGDRYPHYAFAHLRPEFAEEVRPGDVLVGGRNWGLGSSREYAPRALKRLGVAAIVAHGFARIHYRNLLNLGIPAYAAPDVAAQLEDGDPVRFDPLAGELVRLERAGGPERRLELPPAEPFLRDVLAAGSVLAYYQRHRRLPGESGADPPDAADA